MVWGLERGVVVIVGVSFLGLVDDWGVAGGGVVADVVWYCGGAGGGWCVEFVEV